MNLEPSTIIAVLAGVGGIAATWGALGHRIRQLEIEAVESKVWRAEVTALNAKVETIRKDQGARLGEVEADTAVLKGKFEGFQTGFSSGRRSRTAAQGHAVGEKGGE